MIFPLIKTHWFIGKMDVGAIAEDENKSALFEQKAERQYLLARNVDAQQTTSERLRMDRFAKFRGNSRTLARRF